MASLKRKTEEFLAERNLFKDPKYSKTGKKLVKENKLGTKDPGFTRVGADAQARQTMKQAGSGLKKVGKIAKKALPIAGVGALSSLLDSEELNPNEDAELRKIKNMGAEQGPPQPSPFPEPEHYRDQMPKDLGAFLAQQDKGLPSKDASAQEVFPGMGKEKLGPPAPEADGVMMALKKQPLDPSRAPLAPEKTDFPKEAGLPFALASQIDSLMESKEDPYKEAVRKAEEKETGLNKDIDELGTEEGPTEAALVQDDLQKNPIQPPNEFDQIELEYKQNAAKKLEEEGATPWLARALIAAVPTLVGYAFQGAEGGAIGAAAGQAGLKQLREDEQFAAKLAAKKKEDMLKIKLAKAKAQQTRELQEDKQAHDKAMLPLKTKEEIAKAGGIAGAKYPWEEKMQRLKDNNKMNLELRKAKLKELLEDKKLDQKMKEKAYDNSYRLAKDTNQRLPVKQFHKARPKFMGLLNSYSKGLKATRDYEAGLISKDDYMAKVGSSDLAFVFDIGKILDPDSVVREGEQRLIMSSGADPVMEKKFKQIAEKYFGTGRRLSDADRSALMELAKEHMNPLTDQYNEVVFQARDHARRNNLELKDLPSPKARASIDIALSHVDKIKAMPELKKVFKIEPNDIDYMYNNLDKYTEEEAEKFLELLDLYGSE